MLRRATALAMTATIVMGAAAAHVRAALDDTAPPVQGLELLVMEVENCHVCALVRSHIQPAYAQSTNAREAPMRFVDLNTVDEAALGLSEPVTVVPTIVLMREGREVARISGYTGPQIFFEALGHMLARTD